MRATAALVLSLVSAAPASAGASPHQYTAAQRYAGCLFGEAVPLIRRGADRERALSAASDRCIGWSASLSASDVRQVDVEVHRAIEAAEHQGL